MIAKEKIDLSAIPEEDLLRLRIKDLPLSIEGTWLWDCVKELYQELEAKGIKFKPVCYLADEWFAPDQDPQISLPFFLAQPTLIKLEKKMMREAEGETKSWCMQLLRHEAGHAINYAYKLYQSPDWKKIFGSFSKAYGDAYRFRPYSKSFVRHLEKYYAQCHPDEDFAETFAVWLTPGLDWQTQYKGWKALAKLQYVDKVVQEIKDKPPLVKKGKKYRKASSLNLTLANYYKKKKHIYAEDFPDFHDTNLIKIFSDKSKTDTKQPYAYSIIKKYKDGICDDVSIWTGEKKFIINDLLETMIKRCKHLGLLNSMPEQQAILKISIYVTALIMNYVHTGRFLRKKWKRS
ncbi:MAG: putative zinc-binding metallopeptidase [Candidatus Omnitrophota bacterium]|nr:putative zinc-binding metallopeptidase [Candidatus Omnitrophota bacterium]